MVDNEHHLLGIITHDDVIDVMREEATEDAHRIGGVDPLEQSYLATSLLTLAWKRGIWLTVLFIGSLTTAYALRQYEGSIAEVAWLVLFLPMVISTGGNSGNQSATLVITALSTKELDLRDWARVVRRELITGALLGGFLGMIGSLIAALLAPTYLAAVVIPLTLLLVVMAGTLVGSMLPLLFKRLGLDPAIMSNPFVAGIIDIMGILIYIEVALAIFAMSRS